jgi:hypothetical protein
MFVTQLKYAPSMLRERINDLKYLDISRKNPPQPPAILLKSWELCSEIKKQDSKYDLLA